MIVGAVAVTVLIEAAAEEDAMFEDVAEPELKIVPYPIPPRASNTMINEVSHEYFQKTIDEIEEYAAYILVRPGTSRPRPSRSCCNLV